MCRLLCLCDTQLHHGSHPEAYVTAENSFLTSSVFPLFNVHVSGAESPKTNPDRQPRLPEININIILI